MTSKPICAKKRMCNAYLVFSRQPKTPMVRVRLVEFLCQLSPQNPLHHSFANLLLSALLEKYQEVVQLSSGNIFINSLAHRQKNRLMQFAVVLEPFISQVPLLHTGSL